MTLIRLLSCLKITFAYFSKEFPLRAAYLVEEQRGAAEQVLLNSQWWEEVYHSSLSYAREYWSNLRYYLKKGKKGLQKVYQKVFLVKSQEVVSCLIDFSIGSLYLLGK